MSKLTPKHLGRLSEQAVPEDPRSILDTFDNPRSGRDYQIELIFPEYTSMCPVTGQPDFATITIRYTPAALCVEMKSLKLYLQSYRNRGAFYEQVTNTILDDLVAVVEPVKMSVIGNFNPRGGMVGIITAEHVAMRDSVTKRAAQKEGL